MIRSSTRALLTLAALLLFALGSGALSLGAGVARAEAAPDRVRHLSLVQTMPAADAVLSASPPEIRLTFSEAPQLPGSTLRLTRGEEDLVATTTTAADPQDAKQLVIRPEAALAPGSYTVHWRAIAQDGHAQRGTYSFRIAAQ